MKKNRILSLLLLALMAVLPATAQIVIDEIMIATGDYEVNKDMVVRFDVTNHTGMPMSSTDYEVTVKIGGVEAGSVATTKDIANNSYETLRATVAPHVAGENLPVEIILTGMGTFSEVAPVTVNVAPEVFVASKTVGTPNACETQRVIYPYYNYSQSETVYTPDLLNLVEGAKITSLTFKGYKEAPHSIPLKVWVELTDDTAPVSAGTTFVNTDAMTVAYDGSYNLEAVGEGSATYDEHGDIISVTLAQPIEYVAGKSLRVVCEAKKGASYKTCYFECDKNVTGKSVLRYSDFSSAAGESTTSVTIEDKTFEQKTLPVLYLGIDQEAPVLSGTATIRTKDTNVVPLAGATVQIKNGNVMYSATTAADGKYSMTVCKPGLEYTVGVESDDYVIFPYADVLNMNGASAVKDVETYEAFGAYVLDAEIPYNGIVNNPMTVVANIANFETTDMDDTNTVITLTYGDPMEGEAEVVAQASDFIIDPYDAAEVELTFTPHKPYNGQLSVNVYYNGEFHSSEAATVDIVQELASADFTIGEGEQLSYVANAPVRLYSNHSYSQTVITSDLLDGLKPGSKIVGIKLQSAQSSNAKNFDINLKAWMMNTTDGTDNITIDPYSTDLKQVYEGTIQQKSHGKVSETPTEYGELINITFSEPFIYTGQNIRIAMQADNPGGYQQTYFKALRNHLGSKQKSKDSTTEVKDLDWGSATEKTPVFTFVIDNATILTGSVVDSETLVAIEGAEVKLTSADADTDIVYTGTTDAEGKFEITVVQNDNNYNVTVSHEGYKDSASTLDAGFATQDLGIINLVKDTATAITGIVKETVSGVIYDLAGRKTNAAQRGILIIDGKKVIK